MAISVDEWVNSKIGFPSDKKCPDCGERLTESSDGTVWCFQCSYSNDSSLTEFIKSLE